MLVRMTRLRRAVTLRWRREYLKKRKQRKEYVYKLKLLLLYACAQTTKKGREWVNPVLQERKAKGKNIRKHEKRITDNVVNQCPLP